MNSKPGQTNDEEILWNRYHTEPSIENRNTLALYYLDKIKSYAINFGRKIAVTGKLDDYVSEVYIQLLKSIVKFDQKRGANFLTWFYTRLRGTYFDYLREEDFVGRSARARGIKIKLQTNTQFEIISHVKTKCVSKDFSELIKPLSKIDKVIFIMYYKMNLTMKEIGCNLRTVESRISQRIKKAKELIKCQEEKNLQRCVLDQDHLIYVFQEKN